MRLTIEVYCETRVMFMPKKIFIGKSELDLSTLVTNKGIPKTTLPLTDEKNRKAIGGSVCVSVAVRAPWNGKDSAKELIEEVIYFDDHTVPKAPNSVAGVFILLVYLCV